MVVGTEKPLSISETSVLAEKLGQRKWAGLGCQAGYSNSHN